MKLREMLNTMSVDDLRAIARTYALRLGPAPAKYELVDGLSRHLSSRAVNADILVQLSHTERQALDDLLAGGGRMIARLFEREHGMIRFRNPFIYGRAQDQTDRESAATSLYYRGLICKTYGSVGAWNGEIYVIPEEVMALLPTVKKRPFKDILTPTGQPAQMAPQGDLLWDIGMLLCYLQRESVRAVRGDQLPKRDVLRLNQTMSLQEDLAALRTEPEALWLSFVHHMAATLGLLRAQGGLISPSEKAEEWLRQTVERRTWETWRRYQKDASWNEISQSVPEGYAYYFSDPQRVIGARTRMMEALKLCPVGQWLTVASLGQAMKTHDPLFLRSRGSEMASLYWDAYSGHSDWDHIEQPYVVHTLSHSLAWLGVVECAGPAAHSPTAFRLTERGALLLGLRSGKIADPPAAPIVVQPNYEIVAPQEASPSVLYRLQQVATLAKSDRASIYVLGQNAIWRSLQAGDEIERIISFLEKASQRPLPQNVAYSLREWAGKHGELTLEQATLFTAASDALMAEVRANKKIGLPVQATIAPRVVTLRDGDMAALVEQLKKAGYWPKVGKGVPEAVRASEAAHTTVAVKSNDLAHLLAGALALAHISEALGWNPPVSDALIRNLSYNLPPVLVKQVQRMANEAIARYESHSNTEGSQEKSNEDNEGNEEDNEDEDEEGDARP
jgi:hypothetical protein